MDPDQTFYYPISDPLQNLDLKVTLRRTNKSNSRRGKEKKGGKKNKSSSRYKDEGGEVLTVEKSLEWQEKVFGPREIALLSPDSTERAENKSPRTPRSKGNVRSVYDADYKNKMLRNFRDGMDPLDDISEAMIFTYVDKDSFVPKSKILPKLTTSENCKNPSQNPLGLAAATLPIRQLPKDILPISTNTMKGHLSREAPFKIMYVMAAVDCDVERLKKGGLDKNEDEIFGGPAKAGGPRFYEKVLCTIKVYRNNTMETTPGFSEEEPEDESNPMFTSSHDLNMRQMKGSKLSTFRFTTPRGSQYEYTIENKNAVPSVVSAERMIAEEMYKDKKKVEERRNRSGRMLFGKPNSVDVPFFLHVNLEIVSAMGFDDQGGFVFAEYETVLPKSWSFASQVPGVNWGGRNPPNELTVTGTTHMARPMYLKPKISATNETAFGTANVPRSTEVMSGYRSKFLGTIMFLSIVVGMILGEAYIVWLFGALFMLVSIMGLTSSGIYEHELADPVYHFGHPTSIHLAPPTEYLTNPTMMSSAPSILFQLSSKHAFQRHIIEGYGFVKIPTTPGNYETDVKLWVPRGGIRSEMRNFFIGGAYRLHDLRSIEMPADMGGASFLSKFGFRTEKSGTLKIRMSVAAQAEPVVSSDGSIDGDLGRSQTLNGRSTVEDILTRVRNNRKMGIKTSTKAGSAKAPLSPLRRRSLLMDQKSGGGGGGAFFDEPSLSTESTGDNTYGSKSMGSSADILARVRARKAERGKNKAATR